MIWHKLNPPKFCHDLISYDTSNTYNMDSTKSLFSEDNLDAVEYVKSPLSCGQAHAAMIQNGILYTWGKSSSGR